MPRDSGSQFGFPSVRGHGHIANLQATWGDLRNKAGLDDVRIHDLRHTYASFAADAGASLPLIGTLLGHASPTTTARYAHIADSRARDLNTDVGNVIGRAMGKQGRPRTADGDT